MGPKKKPKTIKSNLFAGSSPLTVDDLSLLQVDSFGPQAAVLLDDLNWSQEVIAITGLKLALDNRRILSSSVFLLGSIFEDKSVNAANFWNLESATSLILSIQDSSIFSFPTVPFAPSSWIRPLSSFPSNRGKPPYLKKLKLQLEFMASC